MKLQPPQVVNDVNSVTDTGTRDCYRSPFAVLLLIVAATLCACSPPGTQSVLHRGLGPEPESLDPHRARTTQAHTVQRDLFEGLITYSPSGELVPGVAERWELSDDGKTYTFQLREDARWSNGDTLTAADFEFSFKRLVAPETAAFYGELLHGIRNADAIIEGDLPPAALGVTALDAHQLQITLDHPVPYFLSLLALPSAYPVYRPGIAEHGDNFARPGRLVSNGAYKLQQWQLGAYLELVRNEHYWNNAATGIDRVRHHVTVEASAELYRYRAGELDITQSVPSEAYALVKKERPQELKVAPFLGTYFYGFNLRQPKLAGNPPLRRALSMAVDREILTEMVTARGEQPAYSWVPPGVLNYEPRRFSYADMPRDERHAQARRLYREAGYGPEKPLELTIRYNTAETHERIALAIQDMWREVLGFEAELINEEFRVLVANIRAAEMTEVFRLTWNGDYNDANSFLSMFESGNPSNLAHYSNEEFDSLMQRAGQQTDLERRRLFLEEAERVLLDDHPVIPLYYHVSKHLVSPRVVGWQDNVLDFHYSQHLKFARQQ